MKRKHIDDICIGDKFKDEHGDIFEVMRFHGRSFVFLECNTDMGRDTYSNRDNKLLDRINSFSK